MQIPLLSIIIPTYNAQGAIEAAISSILNQSFKEWEIQIIDGDSTDETIKTITQLAGNDHRIKFISEADRGIYDGMNKGVALASGKWVYFLGSDDKLMPEILTPISEILKTTSCDIIYGNVQSSRFGGKYDGVFDADKILVKNICHQAVFFRKIIFKKTGSFTLRYKAHADWDHNMKWMLDNTIQKKYVDLVITDYADGGFSSTNGDPVFAKEKLWNYLSYGRSSLSLDVRKNLSFRKLKLAIKNLELRNILSYGFYWVKTQICG